MWLLPLSDIAKTTDAMIPALFDQLKMQRDRPSLETAGYKLLFGPKLQLTPARASRVHKLGYQLGVRGCSNSRFKVQARKLARKTTKGNKLLARLLPTGHKFDMNLARGLIAPHRLRQKVA